ncbi:zinc finger protein 317-like [Sitodiplosis mosellana]|uniref:zinc finger protein 317-like n=1 Tax=Sitodiplosis mosellana TaxID=263140 RepID=UPI0024442886|nr:zinc finger protein 317-like [Sitodiplosis mosellana]
MENVCRLCAGVKTPKQLKSSIEDQSLNIEQKLIDCCRWKSFDPYETYNLPRLICNSCLKNLEKSWAFAESVAQAQQELLAQMAETKPTVLLEIESVDTVDNKNVPSEEYIEEIKVSLSPRDAFSYEHDFTVDETVPVACNYEDTTSDDNKWNLNAVEAKQKDRIDINVLTLLSENDKNSDGTINKDKVLELDLDDWTMVKWRCCVCKGIFENHRQLKAHFDQKHTEDTLKILCSFCNTSFGKRRSVLRHIVRKHRPYLKLSCKKCGTFFWNQNALKSHISISHAKPEQLGQLCEICGKSFTSESKLQHHTRLHLPIEQRRSFECYVCKSHFAYKKSLVHHMPIHWGQKIQYQCDVCLSKFSRTDALKRHSLIHLGKLPHECQYCGKGFRTKFNLKVHERIHTGERPYACSFCEYRSADGPNLGKHIKQRHKNQMEMQHSIFAQVKSVH